MRSILAESTVSVILEEIVPHMEEPTKENLQYAIPDSIQPRTQDTVELSEGEAGLLSEAIDDYLRGENAPAGAAREALELSRDRLATPG